MADKNTENKNGDDLGYGSHRKNIMDEGLTLMGTTRKVADENTNEVNEHENWTKNGKPNRNDHMDETGVIILKKRRSNTEKAMTPSGETDFQRKFPWLPLANTESSDADGLEQWKYGAPLWNRWTRISETPSSSENALAYCLQAIAETDEKVGIMTSHIAKMEEEIHRVLIIQNELLANAL
jgi:hypothetical protein